MLGTGVAPARPEGRYHLKVVRLLSFATRALLFFNMLCDFSDWRRDWFPFRFGRRNCGRQIGLFDFPPDIAARFRPHIIKFCPPDFGGFQNFNSVNQRRQERKSFFRPDTAGHAPDDKSRAGFAAVTASDDQPLKVL